MPSKMSIELHRQDRQERGGRAAAVGRHQARPAAAALVLSHALQVPVNIAGESGPLCDFHAPLLILSYPIVTISLMVVLFLRSLNILPNFGLQKKT